MNANHEIEMFSLYLRNVKNRSEKTIDAYSRDLREFCAVFDFKTSLNEITREDVETVYIANLAGNGNCAASRSRKLSSVKSFFKWAVINGIVVENPVENVESPKIAKKAPKVMTICEVSDVIESAKSDNSRESACEGFRNLAVLAIMFGTGVRREELTEIKLQDIDLREGSVLIHGKGNKERIAYFNEATQAIVSEYILCHRQKLKPAQESEYVFVSKRHGKLSPSTVNRIVNKYFAAADIKQKGFTAHSTRKAFATQVYKNTGDIFVVQNLLGHSSPAVTQRYVGMSESAKKKAAMTVNF